MEDLRVKSPTKSEFKVLHDFYKSPQGPAIGDRMKRNNDFYKDPSGKTVAMYPKELVYPRQGGEFTLEEIRARLPQYQVNFDEFDDNGMEFTCMAPIPPVYESSDVKKVKEHHENIPPIKSEKLTLESLCAVKENLGISVPSRQQADYHRKDDLAEREAELEQLLASKGTTPNLQSSIQKQGSTVGYGFTPQTGPGWSVPDENSTCPQRALSYSDTRSFSTTGSMFEGSQAYGTFRVYEDSSCADQSGLQRRSDYSLKQTGTRSGYASGFDLSGGSFRVREDSYHASYLSSHRAGKENSQQMSEPRPIAAPGWSESFGAHKEPSRQPLVDLKKVKPKDFLSLQSSLCDGNFEVYEDSTAESSANQEGLMRESHQVPISQLGGSCGGIQTAPLPLDTGSVFERSITMVGIPHSKEQLRKLSSTPNNLEKTASLLPTIDVTGVLELNKLKLEDHMPSGLPSCTINPMSVPAPHQHLLGQTEPSQPAHQEDEGKEHFFQPTNLKTTSQPVLDTITEEQSWNASTTGSGSSTDFSGGRNVLVSTAVPTPYLMLSSKKPVNPFKVDIIDHMIKHIIHVDAHLQKVEGSLPQQIVGAKISTSGASYQIHKKIGKGAFATVYKAVDSSNQTVAVKIQRPAEHWEYAIVKELHSRLQSEGRSYVKEMFVDFFNGAIIADASVLVLQLHPLGTLLELANSSTFVSERVVAMVIASTLEGVGVLHKMDILHGDIKPDNLLMRRTRSDRIGVVLSDFSRAVDLRAFPKDMVFLGSSCTSAFECLQMRKNESWKWQVDCYALAVTIHILAHRNYNFETVFCEETARYRIRRKVPRHWHQDEWHELMSYLLNMSSQDCPNFRKWIDKLSSYADSVIEEDILELFK